MANTTITKILLRRGPEADRMKVTPTMGEPLFTIDTHRLYIGDGATQGGFPAVSVDTNIFQWRELVDGVVSDVSDPPTAHQVLSLKTPLGIDLQTSGQIKTTNTGVGCGEEAAIVASVGGIFSNGDINTKGDVVSFCSSDERLKDNIKPLENSLDRVDEINGVTFVWNGNQETYEGEDTGLIAQDVQALQLPGLVTTRDDGYLAIKYEKVVPLLVECIKELKEKVQQLEKKLDE